MSYLIVVLGIVSGLAAAWVTARMARAADRRPAASFALCGFVLSLLVYGGALQALVRFVHPTSAVTAFGAEAVFLAFTGVSALIAVAAATGIVAAWIALFGSGDGSAARFRTTGLAILFSLAAVILAAPFLIHNQIAIERSLDANEAEVQAFSTSYRSGLEKLTELGALNRIEVDDDAVTHYVGGPLYKVGEQGLAEYARAAMIYHTRVLGNAPAPVVLRDSATETKIGTFRTDGVFVIHTAAIPPAEDMPH